VRFSIAIPQFDYHDFDGGGLRSYLVRAEELGFEGGWLLEQTVGTAPLLAPLELLAYCAAFTERLRLGVAVLVTSLHEPLQLAQSVTAVDRISHEGWMSAWHPAAAPANSPPSGWTRTTSSRISPRASS